MKTDIIEKFYYSQVSIKQASSLNYFEEIFHPACLMRVLSENSVTGGSVTAGDYCRNIYLTIKIGEKQLMYPESL